MIRKFWTNMMVNDIHGAIAFYRDVLGFEHVMSVPAQSDEVLMDYDGSRPLVYALIRCGAVELMFQERASLQENVPAFDGVSQHGGTLTFYFEVDDIEDMARRLAGHARMVKELHTTFYGMRELYVKDPEGYILGFAQPAAAG
jgi:uncharacterized glyoxalase superfamily protein PhnB